MCICKANKIKWKINSRWSECSEPEKEKEKRGEQEKKQSKKSERMRSAHKTEKSMLK